ncbi:C cytochrome precursor [Stieleria sp. JC731]|uniref:multiheme c-type cytochrome n=1 Tax=Pirellulaceae TaxID=2691357 RepID=UPI001E4B36CC|nr:multiheme c-type cytochrome [Stieleria sp. JC731]MCC9602449.1 C cytochrome precursor [Stieleria sp. JC731]
MNSKRLLLILPLLAFLAWVGFNAYQAKQADDQFQQIRKARTFDVPSQQNPSTAPPADLVVAKIPTDNIWFVGKHEDGGGVEIPFKPGESPKVSAHRANKNTNPGFVGPQQCKECHAEIYQTFVQTAHALTTRPVTADTIDGSFSPGSNTVQSSDPNLRFEMVNRDNEFLQRVHFHNWTFEVPMQIIVGSSKMAQTYLYWHGDGLYQHNITHITDGNQWINSPGYIDGDAAYARPVPERCLDCHMTYFDFRAPPNHYTPEDVIYGVTCERCHGPAAEHVAFHQSSPNATTGESIVNPGSLERELSMQICGQCHGGSRQLKSAGLSFRPGDQLDDHYQPLDEEENAKNSVHTSNQQMRLSQSRCFIETEMSCIDCHDPHHNERGDAKLFSERCMTCHQDESDCQFDAPDGIRLSENCVDCHMPRRATKKLRLQSIEGDVFPPLRDHFIRVDKQATDEFLKSRQQ